MAQTESARLLTPLGLLGALGVAAGVWFVPLPGAGGPAQVVRVGPGSTTGSEENASVQAVGATPDHDWLALERPLSTLREPLVEDEEPPDTPIDVRPPVNVRYLGFVGAGEDRSAALLEIDGTQRFLTEGDTIRLDNRDDVVIEEITPEKIVYSMGSVNNTVPRSTAEDGQSPNSPAQPAMPPTEDRLRGRVSLR